MTKNKKETAIETALRHARDVHPELHARTEAVARIIAPEAFAEGWVVHPPSAATLHALKLKVLQGNALEKAHAVLTFLGVNTDTDWYEILRRIAQEPPSDLQDTTP